MNQNTIIGGIVVLLAIVLGIWYISSSNTNTGSTVTDKTATATTSNSTTGNVTSNTAAGTSQNPNTFHSIFTQSGNNQCSYEQVSASSRASSVIYIADGKMRGEFRTMTGTKTIASLMIYNGGYLYTWEEGKTTGKKTVLKSLSDLPQAIPQDLSSGAVFGKSLDNVSWDCHSWAKDPKVFVIPSYVKFTSA